MIVQDLARFEGKELHHVMQNTVMEETNRGFRCMQQVSLVFVEWATGFDFLPVPKGQEAKLGWRRVENDALRLEWDNSAAKFEKQIPEGSHLRSYQSSLSVSG
jgi:hypothetical protein